VGQLCCSIERKLAAKQPVQTRQVCQAQQRHGCRSLYTFNVSCYLRTKMGRLPQTKAGFIASKYETLFPSLHASSYTYAAACSINRIVAGDKWSFCGSRHIWDVLTCQMGIGKLSKTPFWPWLRSTAPVCWLMQGKLTTLKVHRGTTCQGEPHRGAQVVCCLVRQGGLFTYSIWKAGLVLHLLFACIGIRPFAIMRA